jgi:hypothetical protein
MFVIDDFPAFGDSANRRFADQIGFADDLPAAFLTLPLACLAAPMIRPLFMSLSSRLSIRPRTRPNGCALVAASIDSEKVAYRVLSAGPGMSVNVAISANNCGGTAAFPEAPMARASSGGL